LALLGVSFAGLVLWVNFRPMSHGRPGPTRIALANMAAAIDVFEVDTGRYPESFAEVEKAWTTQGAGSPRPAWTNVCTDEWGRAFRYQRKGRGFEIRSAGRDGIFNTADDIWQ
jgi:hypothetical protein